MTRSVRWEVGGDKTMAVPQSGDAGASAAAALGVGPSNLRPWEGGRGAPSKLIAPLRLSNRVKYDIRNIRNILWYGVRM